MFKNTTRIPGIEFLHSPGPTHLPIEVQNAMHRQSMEHGDPRINDLIYNCEAGLRHIAETNNSNVFM